MSSSITRNDVRELAWLLRMETDPHETMATLFERVRARAAQLTRIVDCCAGCAALAADGPRWDDRKLAASASERPERPRLVEPLAQVGEEIAKLTTMQDAADRAGFRLRFTNLEVEAEFDTSKVRR